MSKKTGSDVKSGELDEADQEHLYDISCAASSAAVAKLWLSAGRRTGFSREMALNTAKEAASDALQSFSNAGLFCRVLGATETVRITLILTHIFYCREEQ